MGGGVNPSAAGFGEAPVRSPDEATRLRSLGELWRVRVRRSAIRREGGKRHPGPALSVVPGERQRGPGPACAGTTAEFCSRAHSQIQFSNSLSQRSAARILCGVGYAVVSSLAPLKYEGDGAPSGATIVLVVPMVPLETTGRLSARHHGVFLTAPGRASRWPSISGTAIRQPAPGGRLLVATERSPGAARVRALRKSTRAGAASDPTRMTPHESAPRWTELIGLYSEVGLKSRLNDYGRFRALFCHSPRMRGIQYSRLFDQPQIS
jgi:hypothetical protein